MTFLLAIPVVSGAAMFLLALGLLRVDPSREATRAFSLLLITRGASLFALATMTATNSTEIARIATAAYCGLCLASVVALIYFVAVYPARRFARPDANMCLSIVLLALLAIGLLVAFFPGIAIPDAPLTGTGPAMVVDWLTGNPRRPLGVAPTLLDLTMAVPAIAFLRDYLRTDDGKRRETLLIVGLGFFAPAACSCMIGAIIQQLRGYIPMPQNPGPFNFAEMGLFALWAVVLIALLGFVTARALRAATRSEAKSMVLFAMVIVISSLIGTSTGLTQDPEIGLATLTAMLGFWSGTGAALVAYAILRYSLFDIEWKLKISIQRSTVAAVFVGVYFLVSEVGSVWFADVSGSAYWGVAAAGILLLALQPLQRLAERLVNGILPGAGSLAALDAQARADFYREHVDLMWMDGHLSPKDRIVLANLRAKLGLDPRTAEAIELDVLSANVSAVAGGEASREHR